MRILIINTLYSPYKVGGAEVSVQLLAEGLVSAGNQVRVLSLHELNYIKRDIINGVEVCYVPLVNIYWPFKKNFKPSRIKKLIWHVIDNYNPLMKKFVKLEILDFKPDVVHTNNLAGFSVAVWDVVKANGIRLVHTARDYYLFHPNCTLFKNGTSQNPNELNVKFWSWIKKNKSQNVDYFVGISDFIRSFYLDNGFFDKKKSTFIYNPVDKISKLNFKKDIEIIGFIGSLTIEKGFDVFCDIAKENSKKYKFCAAGRFKNNDELSFLEKKANDSNVFLLGFISFEDFINYVDAVILPIKWNEPFGRVIVESAISGVTVFTEKKGGVIELFDILNNVKLLNEFNQENIDISIQENNYYIFNKDYVNKEYFKIYFCEV